MPAARKDLHLATSDGSMLRDPRRYSARARVAESPPLGAPSDGLDFVQAHMWQAFVAEFPGLREAHRCRLEIAVRLRASMTAGLAKSADLALLNRVVRQLAEDAADAGGGDPDDDGDL
jgi:hypothetical protein